MPAGPKGKYGLMVLDQPLLNDGKVRYVGDPVAAVVAESEEIAYSALALIDVDYEIFPEVSSVEGAQMPERQPCSMSHRPGSRLLPAQARCI